MSIMKKIMYVIAGVAAFVFLLVLEAGAALLFLIVPLALFLLWKTDCTEERELAHYRETGNFPGGRPLWKRIGRGAAKVFLLLVIGGVLSLFAVPFSFNSLNSYGHAKSGLNSHAKLMYSNAASCLVNYEKHGGDPSDMDGTYWGSLQPEQGKEYSFRYGPGKEGFNDNMKALTGSMSQAYYYVVIREGFPVQAFWSKSDELLYYAERYAERFGGKEIEGDFYIGGKFIGRYPEPMDHPVESPPEWLHLTFSDSNRIFINDLRENGVYYIIFIAPLLIYLIVGLFTKISDKLKKETPALENVRSDKIN